ncbi:MAG: hypothetical protein ACRC8S_11155 [Fimbriiglobus sp.]
MADEVDDNEGEIDLWTGIKYGLGSIGIGIVIFFVFMLMEAGGRGGRVHWLIALAYYIGGKWVVGGFFWLIGLLMLGIGIRTHIRDRNES